MPQWVVGRGMQASLGDPLDLSPLINELGLQIQQNSYSEGKGVNE